MEDRRTLDRANKCVFLVFQIISGCVGKEPMSSPSQIFAKHHPCRLPLQTAASAAKPHPGARAICKVPSSRSSNTPMHPSPRSCCGRFPRGLRWTPPSSRVCLGGYSVTIRPARQAKTSYGSRPRSSMFDNNGSGPTTRPAGGAATLASPAAMRAIGSSEPCCCQRTGRRSTKNTPW